MFTRRILFASNSLQMELIISIYLYEFYSIFSISQMFSVVKIL